MNKKVKMFSENVQTEIVVVEEGLRYLLSQLELAKLNGNKAAAQRFRVFSISLEKKMKNLRRLMIDDK